MSGRSAHVRKKITQTQLGQGIVGDGIGGSGKGGLSVERVRTKSSVTSSSDDNATVSDFPLPLPLSRQDTAVGVGTTNARFLKFSGPGPIRENEISTFRGDIGSGSQSGGSTDGRRETASISHHFNGPLQDFAYARARRPVIKTEDVSGIEKSGLRSKLDKKSEEVRRGIAKTFTFRKKDKKAADANKATADLEFRPPSSATVRPPSHGLHRSPPPPPPLQEGFDLGGYDSQYSSELNDNDHELPHRQHPHYQRAQTQPHQLHPRFQHRHQHQPWEADPSIAAAQPPSGSLPPIKRWIGGGRPVQRWNKLRKDPELWDPDGDVLVFLTHQDQQPRPHPSFRLSSHIIEATESRYLIMLLREGSSERNMNGGGGRDGLRSMSMRQRNGSILQSQSQSQMPSPTSPDDSEADPDISYEMYFPSPPNLARIDQLRYHITTRNVFALLYHASLVGLSLHQTLSDLHARLNTYMSTDTDNLGAITQYLGARGVDDVRGDAEAAVSLLAWSESPDVRWDAGFCEFFVHSSGMYGNLEACTDFKGITPITRALLERAYLETQLRVQAAEERLADFDFGDMWPASVATTTSTSGPVAVSPAKAAADRLQKFFHAYYSRVYGCWPPPPIAREGATLADDGDDMWLSRSVAQVLQRDFSALYDCLVNRDIVWDGSETRPGRKWMLVSESGNRTFEPDTPDLPMTDMFVEFDNKLRFPHIPHPFPLVPDSIPPTISPQPPTSVKDKSGSKSNGANGQNPPTSGRTAAMERRVALAYNEASNTLLLGSDFVQSDMIDAFTKFEKADRVCEIDPSTARRGRWVLLYGILQTLASVSIDTPNIRHRDGVAYHLSPRLKGAKMPPWKGSGGGVSSSSSSLGFQEAGHELSYCWLVPRTWATMANGNGGFESADSGGSGADSPIRGGFAFPRPPTSASTTSRGRGSTTGGYRAPSSVGQARSIRSVVSAAPSLSSYPQFSSTASVTDSDAGSSVMTPPSAKAPRKGRSITMSAINEVDGPIRARKSREQTMLLHNQLLQHQQQQQHQQQEQVFVRNRSSSRGVEMERLTLALPQPTAGGFIVLDDFMGETGGGYHTVAPASRDRGSNGSGGRDGGGGGGDRAVLGMGRGSGVRSSSTNRSRPSLLRRDTETDHARPKVILDFDDLDSLKSHAP